MSNALKKGLKIDDSTFVNMANIAYWSLGKDYIYLFTSSNEDRQLAIVTDKNEGTGWDSRSVEMGEFQRIQREIEEYMGII